MKGLASTVLAMRSQLIPGRSEKQASIVWRILGLAVCCHVSAGRRTPAPTSPAQRAQCGKTRVPSGEMGDPFLIGARTAAAAPEEEGYGPGNQVVAIISTEFQPPIDQRLMSIFNPRTFGSGGRSPIQGHLQFCWAHEGSRLVQLPAARNSCVNGSDRPAAGRRDGRPKGFGADVGEPIDRLGYDFSILRCAVTSGLDASRGT
jgi:hypothetical protein